jgi:L-lactate dehydrogenase complex protein LldG
MTSRDAILQHVRNELGKAAPVARPDAYEVWPRENPTPAAMAERFVKELADVHGEVVRCGTIEDARRQLADLVDRAQWTSLGAMNRPLVHEVTADLPPGLLSWATPEVCGAGVPPACAAGTAAPQAMAELSASVIEADALLADTGSCLIACPTGPERLLCYLPPACVIIARADRLFEHLPAAWATIAARAAVPTLRGEFVIVTGPSRTSDIEKTLILGVHGPKRLVVILVER